jgi:uncharacterized protein involved in exopolysaccharide biosynthesis
VTDPFSHPSDQPDSGAVNPGARGALIERPGQLPMAAHHHLHHPGLPEERPNRLLEYWEVILRRRWTVLTCFLIVVVAMMAATFLTTKIYRATLTMQIDQQEAKIVATEGVASGDNYYDSQNFYQTQYELLKSEALAQRVIEQLNLVAPAQTARKGKSWLDIFKKQDAEPAAPLPEESETGLITGLPGMLTVAPIRNSRLVRVHFDSPDPQMAARIANEISVAFIKLNLERRMEATSYARTFLQERLAQIKVKLEDSEKQLNAFTRK